MKNILGFTATVGLLLGTVLLSTLAARRSPESLALPLDRIPAEIAGWTAVGDEALPDDTLRVLAPSAYLVRTYRKESSTLGLFIAFYAEQRAGESMHSPKNCLPGSGWEIWKHDSAFVPVHGEQILINKYSVQGPGSRMLMFYWYQSKSRIVANEYLGKILLARDAVIGGHTAGSIVRIMLPDTPAATAEGVGFAAGLIPEVERHFGSRLTDHP